MKPIGIAFMIESINSIAGTEKQVLQHIERLDKNEFNPILICLRKPSGYFEFHDKDHRYHELNIKSLLSFKALTELWKVRKILKKEKIQILQTYFFDATIIGVIAGRLAGVNKILSSRRDLGFWYTRKVLAGLKLMNKYTNRLVANSNAVKKEISRIEGCDEEKIDVIYNGINAEKYAVSRKNGKSITVGIVANLNRPVKRVDVFIKAALLVLQNNKEINFEVVGDGYLREELETLSMDGSGQEGVRFLGRKSNVPEIIAQWDIGVLSSDTEGFSNSILEYMATGIPVVATTVGGNVEVIENGKNGFLVDPGDFEAMSDKITWLIENEQERKLMGKNARTKIMDQYDWVGQIERLESYYQRLLDQ